MPTPDCRGSVGLALEPDRNLVEEAKMPLFPLEEKKKKVQFRGKTQNYGLAVPLHRSLSCNVNVIFSYLLNKLLSPRKQSRFMSVVRTLGD